MAKLYIVTMGSIVKMATFDRNAAEQGGLDVVQIDDPVEHEWRVDSISRDELFYKPRRSGRWNGAKVYLTAVDVELPNTEAPKPRYEARAYKVWDTLRDVCVSEQMGPASARVYAKVLNEAHEKGLR